MLGLPTVIDRMLQQALVQVLQPIFEPIFSDNSFGFSLKKFKDKIRELTSRKQGKSITQILYNLKVYTTGWLRYYAIANMKDKISGFNEWTR